MTTKEAAQALGKSNAWLYKWARKGRLITRLNTDGTTDWDERDIYRMRVLLDEGVEAEWHWAQQYTVIYCRTETGPGLPTAESRLKEQRTRMIQYAAGRGLNPDLVITEVRPALRYQSLYKDNNRPVSNPMGLRSLVGLIATGKVRTLIVESRDRLGIGFDWFLIETMFYACGGKTLDVANSVWPSAESATESTSWMADLLVLHKVLKGEVRDQAAIDTFMKGYDPKATFLATAKIEAKLLRREKEKKKPNWAKLPPEKRILDLDDCWTP